ncbi:MbeD/MobD family mobilization/exclusion protein [Enterobacter asburiae]
MTELEKQLLSALEQLGVRLEKGK